MAVLKYRSGGEVKTLGVVKSGTSGVSSVNGKTGAITGVYASDNPPPYPVTSVNGKTGNVKGIVWSGLVSSGETINANGPVLFAINYSSPSTLPKGNTTTIEIGVNKANKIQLISCCKDGLYDSQVSLGRDGANLLICLTNFNSESAINVGGIYFICVYCQEPFTVVF